MNKETYKAQWYRSPLSLPEGKSGKITLTRELVKKGEELPVIGFRQALLRGMTPTMAKVQEPFHIHTLKHDDYGVWMTDMPEELNQIAELMFDLEPYGRVLVGGLGLGLLAKVLMMRDEVDHVTVVEKDENVIALCARPGYEVVSADIADYLKRMEERFDFYLLDTWQATSEHTWWSTVMPLRRTIRGKFGKGPTIHCWAEDIMRGQLMHALTNPMTKPHWYYKHMPVPMLKQKARWFLDNVGLPKWEERYGYAVDKATEEQRYDE